MVVMLWAFDGPADNPYRLENHRVHQVVYTRLRTDTLAGRFPDRSPGRSSSSRSVRALPSRWCRSRTCSGSAPKHG